MKGIKKIRLNLGKRSYPILVCYNKIHKIGESIKKLDIGRDAIIISNPIVLKLFGNGLKGSLIESGFNVRFEAVEEGEKAKSEKHCLRLLNNISKFDNLRRRIFLVALGGGVIGDLAGFVASIYKRGVPYIQVPTTLLSQVDSAIGGKVAIDLAVGKNLAGSFYQPKLVFSDISLLKTLPKDELVGGLAEVIKYGIIKSPKLFSFLEQNYKKILGRDRAGLQYIVYNCSRIKAKTVEKDEYDKKDIRVILNLGHTIGHAIEASAHYTTLYTHGQAVALGMLSASFISKELGLLNKAAYCRIRRLIKNVGLPTRLKGLDAQDIYSAQEHDKKFIHGKNRLVLPLKIGKVTVKENIKESLVKRSIESLL